MRMPGKYRVVLQFALAPRDVGQFDRVTEVENELCRHGMLFEVEGHDCTAGRMDIHILTDDPERSFDVVREMIPKCCSYRAGFREAAADEEALKTLAV